MPRRHGADVGAEHHVRVERRDQRLKVPVAGGRQEGAHHLLLAGQIGVRSRGRPWTRWRARLAACRAAAGLRPTIGAIWSKGTPNMSWSTNASRSAGARVSRTTSSARPTESASSASCSGSALSAPLMIGSGTCTPSGSSRRLRRARSIFRHSRATTVVSHPARLPTSAVLTPLSRSHEFCTASSASVIEPCIR